MAARCKRFHYLLRHNLHVCLMPRNPKSEDQIEAWSEPHSLALHHIKRRWRRRIFSWLFSSWFCLLLLWFLVFLYFLRLSREGPPHYSVWWKASAADELPSFGWRRIFSADPAACVKGQIKNPSRRISFEFNARPNQSAARAYTEFGTRR